MRIEGHSFSFSYADISQVSRREGYSTEEKATQRSRHFILIGSMLMGTLAMRFPDEGLLDAVVRAICVSVRH
jgi:hypothetical protein